MTGLLWNEGELRHVVLRDCRIDLAAFAATELEQVVFDGCNLRQADFQDADLVCVRFDGCDLTGVDLTGARMAGCELRACTLDGLAGAERLRGAGMPWADVVGNAALLASALGIRVLED